MTTIRRLFLLSLTAVFLIITTGASCADKDEPAPPFTLEDNRGDTVSLSDYDKKVVVLNFFATWCPPCKDEIPAFVELMNERRDKDFVIIGVVLDKKRSASLDDFIERYDINYPVLIDDGIISDEYGPIVSIPTTFIIDKEGNIFRKIIGARRKSFFNNIIERLL